jgi:cobalt transporter subunit CbtB
MSTSLAASQAHAKTSASSVTVALFAMLLGGLLVYGAGFASPLTIHNAAHDARHAFAFPCH